MFRFCPITSATLLSLGLCGCYPSMYSPYQQRGMYGAPTMYGQPGTIVVPQQPGATGYPLNGTSTFDGGTNAAPADDFKKAPDDRFFDKTDGAADGGVPPARDPGAGGDKGGMFPTDNP